MAINEIPTASTFGGTKETLRTLAASAKRLASGDYNALVTWLIAAVNAIGEDDGTTSGSLRQAITPRVITADATLAATDRLVIIDSADPTISITLDAGSATRAPVEILWPGHATDTRILTLIRDGGTGTIDGASASRVIGVPSAGGISIRVWSAAANEWYTAAGAMPSLMPLVTTASDAIGVGDLGANVVYAAGTVNLTLPPGVLGRRVVILRGIYSTYGINVTPDGAETINAVGGATALPGAAYATVGTAWTLEYFYLEGIGAMWGLHSPGGALSALRSPYTATDTSVVAGATSTWDPQYTTLKTGHAAAITTVTLDSTTGADWVPGKPLRLEVANSGGFGIAIALASGSDTLNGQAAGVGYALLPGSNVIPSASQMPPSYEVIYGGSGAWTIRPLVDVAGRLTTNTSNIATNTSAITALETPATSGRTTVQSGASYTWNVSTYKRLSITYAAAKFALTLSSTGWSAGEERQIDVDNVGGFGVQIILATGTDVLNAQAAGTGYTTLPGSTIIPSASALPASFQITYVGSGVWKIR